MKLDKIIAVRNHKTIYHNGELCIKVFDTCCSKTDILKEAYHHTQMEKTALLLPKLLEVTMIDGKWAIITEYVEGKTIEQRMKEEPNRQQEYLSLLVELQLSIYAVQGSSFDKQEESILSAIAASNMKAAVCDTLKQKLQQLPNEQKVCHGDVQPSNILLTEEGSAYVLDWETVTQGNPLVDAAGAYLFFCLQEDTDMAEQYLELFCAKSGRAKEGILKEGIPLAAVLRYANGNQRERTGLLPWFVYNKD